MSIQEYAAIGIQAYCEDPIVYEAYPECFSCITMRITYASITLL